MADTTAQAGNEYVTVREAAQILRTSTSSIWRWINGGGLPAVRVGARRVLIRRAELDAVARPARPDPTPPRQSGRIPDKLTEAERAQIRAFIEETREQFARDRAAGRSPVGPQGWELLAEARAERDAQLDAWR